MARARTVDEVIPNSPVSSIALEAPHAIVIEPSTEGFDSPAPDSPAVSIAGREDTISLMVSSAFPDAPKMLQVAYCESGNGCGPPLNPTARNPRSTAKGLFQVLDGTRDAYGCGDQLIPEESIKCARKIYDAEGYAPWASSGPW